MAKDLFLADSMLKREIKTNNNNKKKNNKTLIRSKVNTIDITGR